MRRSFLPRRKKISITQKFVNTHQHVDVEIFSFGILFVHEKEHRFTCRITDVI